jgi:hypothetical protein
VKYRDAIRNACIEWGKGGLFRSKSSESQNAVDGIVASMREPTDESLAELVSWLVGLGAQPHAFDYLQPIKAKCKLRDVLNGALLIADPPVRRVQRSYVKPTTEKQSKEKKKRKKTTVTQQTSSSSVSASRQTTTTTTTTTVQPKPQLVVDAPIVIVPTSVKKATRYLMNDCVEASGGNVLDSWTQTSICSLLGIHKANFEGFCAAATGRWLKSGDLKSFKGQKGTIDTIHLQSKYEHGSKDVEGFYSAECGLTDFVGSSAPDFLSAEKVYLAIMAHKGASKHLLAIVPASGDGHAIGITVASDVYHFLDVNEGLARLPNAKAFWAFLWKYVHDTDMGLLKQNYAAFWVASWR